jgi:signal transduction histidine kinase
MSHELRTPLNSVIGFSNVLLRDASLDATARTYLERIRDNGTHLLSLINEVLDISRIEAGRMELEMRPTRVDQIVREAVLATEGAALEKGIRLQVEIPAMVQSISADGKRLKQVLINLVGNAIKFTDTGGVRVRLTCAEGSERPLHVEISDSGIGIPADMLDQIFDAFQQVDSSTSRRYSGSGLGLAISRSLCRLMGFDLLASSRLNHGSTFTVIFDADA